jgi:MFS family permease
MFLITATVGFSQPFVPLYLEASGLRRSQIGLVTGIGNGLALLILPLLGRLSDRLDARRPLMVSVALLSGLAYLGFHTAHSALSFTLLMALGMTGYVYLNMVGGVLVGRMVGATGRGGAAYAGYRVWGSVGYILATLLSGRLVSRDFHLHANLSRAALGPVFTYGPLLFFAIALISLFVPDLRRTASAVKSALNAPRERAPLPSNLRHFLPAFFLYQFALYGASAYLSLYLKTLHASPTWITSVFAAGVVCEVLVMTRVGRFTDTYGRRPALAVAFVLMPLRLLAYIPATGPLWVLLVQTLHGLNFGIMGAIAVVYINDLTTDQHRGAAQARLAVVAGLASTVGPIVGGWIGEHFGLGWMFAVMSLVGTAGAVVFLRQVRESHPAPTPLTTRFPTYLHPLLRYLQDEA